MKRALKYLIVVLLALSATTLRAQQREIRETVTNDFIPSRTETGKSRRTGVQSLACGTYRDSITRYFDMIEEYRPDNGDTLIYRYYRVLFGEDTLCIKERRSKIIRRYGRQQILEVESRIAPHQRFKVAIDGLTEAETDSLAETMRQMKSSDIIMNNSQTCIFYALNLLLDTEGIDPSPVITRNTTFTNGHQLNALFDHLLSVHSTYPCRHKAIRKADLPDRCVLVFRNARNEYIHAVFYRKDTGEFYSKNGLFSPIVIDDIRPIISSYGRDYTTRSDLSEDGLRQLADSIIVFTFNR